MLSQYAAAGSGNKAMSLAAATAAAAASSHPTAPMPHQLMLLPYLEALRNLQQQQQQQQQQSGTTGGSHLHQPASPFTGLTLSPPGFPSHNKTSPSLMVQFVRPSPLDRTLRFYSWYFPPDHNRPPAGHCPAWNQLPSCPLRRPDQSVRLRFPNSKRQASRRRRMANTNASHRPPTTRSNVEQPEKAETALSISANRKVRIHLSVSVSYRSSHLT